jgi:hypothetical protein
MFKKRFGRSILVCAAVLLMAVLGISFGRQKAANANEISLETPASRIRGRKGFNCLAKDQGGTKIQYSAKNADKNGGYYCVECEGSKITAIYISFEKPIARELAFETVKRIAGTDELAEHDAEEIDKGLAENQGLFLEKPNKSDEQICSEYFYFKNGNYAELQFAPKSDDKNVSRIISYRGT